MSESGVPVMTPEIEAKVKAELIRQFEDQYQVKLTIISPEEPKTDNPA